MLPTIELSSKKQKPSTALVLAFGQAPNGEKDKAKEPSYLGVKNKEVDRVITKLRQSKHFMGRKNETSLLRFFETDDFGNTILLGLGDTSKRTPEVSRQAGAALCHLQKRERLEKIFMRASNLFAGLENKEEHLAAFCEGYWLAGYEYLDLKKAEADRFESGGLAIDDDGGKGAKDSIHRAQVLSEAVNFARNLGDRPANFLTPSDFGRLVEKMAKENGIKCRVLGKSELQKENMGLLLGVAQGSVEEPKMIVLEYNGGKRGDRPVLLVGKGVTFDSGGISLKPAARMEDMKYDMMGAAAVAGIFKAISQLEVSVNVVGLIPATENLPSGTAQKPGDVKKSHTGKTVEIINTDAEGRLILADALEYGQKYFNPQAILDFATLTGAVVDALGTVCSGIMGTHGGLLERIKASAAATGERVWELPLFDEYADDLKSNVADIANSGTRGAGSSKGGIFLKFFVDKKYPWVHLDIAGAAYHRKDVNYHSPKYGAGVMVRLVSHLLEHWSTLK